MILKFRTPYKCQNGHFRWLYWEPIDGFKNKVEWGAKHPECKCPTWNIGEGFAQCGESQQYIGIKDKNGNELYVGDIYLGSRYQLTTDGYVKKKHPKEINVYCLIGNKSNFTHPSKVVVVPEHREAADLYSYRGIYYTLDPLSKGATAYNELTDKFDLVGDGETCHYVELVGNIYQTPELIDYEPNKNLHKVW